MDEKELMTPCCNADWIKEEFGESTPYTHTHYSYTCSVCKRQLIHQKESKMTDEKELKLEVGKKYNIPHVACNPYTYFGNKKIYGFNVSRPHTFVDVNGSTTVFNDEELENIQEYHEPKKIVERSRDLWIIYYPDQEPIQHYVFNRLLNLAICGYAESEEEARLKLFNEYDKKYKKVNFTVKFEE